MENTALVTKSEARLTAVVAFSFSPHQIPLALTQRVRSTASAAIDATFAPASTLIFALQARAHLEQLSQELTVDLNKAARLVAKVPQAWDR